MGAFEIEMPVTQDQKSFLDRAPTISGALNFRDLGGHLTADGRRVRWKKLFRSGSLGRLSAQGWSDFRSLKIANIFDLRTTREREREPCAPAAISSSQYHFEAYEMNDVAIQRRMASKSSLASEMRLAMMDYYAEIPWLFAAQYRNLFRHLVEGDVPIVVSCTAGKDRTGVAIALVLYALGVPREQIVEDYCLSDKMVDFEQELVVRQLSEGKNSAAGYNVMSSLTPDARRPLLKSDPDYINAAFSAIATRGGSVRAFLKSNLNLRNEELARLKDHLLENSRDVKQ
jgi:protein-tyrosine phosphatase